MRLSSADLVHLIAAGTILLATAHGLGRLFARFRQLRVAGELLGGLLLGSTLFGLVAARVAGGAVPERHRDPGRA